MKIRNIIITAAVSLLLSSAVLAAGGESFAFLKLGVGTRATGLGCAYTSVADDASAIYYNPAGTANLNGMDLAAETYILSMDRSVNYLAAARSFNAGKGAYGAGIAWINYSAGANIEKRSTDSTDPESLFSDSSNIFIFNLSAKASDRLSLGGNFKFFYESLYNYRGTGVGFDVGGIFRIIEGLNAALDVANINSNIGWNDNSHQDQVPVGLTGGVSYRMRNIFGADGLNLLLSSDLGINTFSGFFQRFGAELNAGGIVSLRAGYNNALCLGAGINLKPSDEFSIKVDYAFITDTIEPGAFNHRLGVDLSYIFPGLRGGEMPRDGGWYNNDR
jgi:hypothetical protein